MHSLSQNSSLRGDILSPKRQTSDSQTLLPSPAASARHADVVLGVYGRTHPQLPTYSLTHAGLTPRILV